MTDINPPNVLDILGFPPGGTAHGDGKCDLCPNDGVERRSFGDPAETKFCLACARRAFGVSVPELVRRAN